jgi:hypothetical protein
MFNVPLVHYSLPCHHVQKEKEREVEKEVEREKDKEVEVEAMGEAEEGVDRMSHPQARPSHRFPPSRDLKLS